MKTIVRSFENILRDNLTARHKLIDATIKRDYITENSKIDIFGNGMDFLFTTDHENFYRAKAADGAIIDFPQVPVRWDKWVYGFCGNTIFRTDDGVVWCEFYRLPTPEDNSLTSFNRITIIDDYVCFIVCNSMPVDEPKGPNKQKYRFSINMLHVETRELVTIVDSINSYPNIERCFQNSFIAIDGDNKLIIDSNLNVVDLKQTIQAYCDVNNIKAVISNDELRSVMIDNGQLLQVHIQNPSITFIFDANINCKAHHPSFKPFYQVDNVLYSAQSDILLTTDAINGRLGDSENRMVVSVDGFIWNRADTLFEAFRNDDISVLYHDENSTYVFVEGVGLHYSSDLLTWANIAPASLFQEDFRDKITHFSKNSKGDYAIVVSHNYGNNIYYGNEYGVKQCQIEDFYVSTSVYSNVTGTLSVISKCGDYAYGKSLSDMKFVKSPEGEIGSPNMDTVFGIGDILISYNSFFGGIFYINTNGRWERRDIIDPKATNKPNVRRIGYSSSSFVAHGYSTEKNILTFAYDNLFAYSYDLGTTWKTVELYHSPYNKTVSRDGRYILIEYEYSKEFFMYDLYTDPTKPFPVSNDTWFRDNSSRLWSSSIIFSKCCRYIIRTINISDDMVVIDIMDLDSVGNGWVNINNITTELLVAYITKDEDMFFGNEEIGTYKINFADGVAVKTSESNFHYCGEETVIDGEAVLLHPTLPLKRDEVLCLSNSFNPLDRYVCYSRDFDNKKETKKLLKNIRDGECKFHIVEVNEKIVVLCLDDVSAELYAYFVFENGEFTTCVINTNNQHTLIKHGAFDHARITSDSISSNINVVGNKIYVLGRPYSEYVIEID